MKLLKLIICVAGLLVGGCVMEPVPKRVTPKLVVNIPPPLYLTWDYTNPIPSNIVFEVWHTRTLNNAAAPTDCFSPPPGWIMLTSVPSPPVKVGGFQCDFFIVRAFDTKTGLYSCWNQ